MNLDEFLVGLGTGLVIGHLITKVTYDVVSEYGTLGRNYRDYQRKERERKRSRIRQEYLIEDIFKPVKPSYKKAIKRMFRKGLKKTNYVIDFEEEPKLKKFVRGIIGKV